MGKIEPDYTSGVHNSDCSSQESRAHFLAVDAGERSKAVRLLDDGIWIESRKKLLPWAARRYLILNRCKPDVLLSKTSWDELFWQSPTLLNGLRAKSIQVVLYPYGWLDSAWVWMEQGQCAKTARQVFDCTCRHLTQVFGEPASTQPICACSDGELYAHWQQGAVHISLIQAIGAPMDDFQYSCLVHLSIRDQG